MNVPSADQPPAGYSEGYSADVDAIRGQEYPLLNGRKFTYNLAGYCLSPLIRSVGRLVRDYIFGSRWHNTLC